MNEALVFPQSLDLSVKVVEGVAQALYRVIGGTPFFLGFPHPSNPDPLPECQSPAMAALFAPGEFEPWFRALSDADRETVIARQYAMTEITAAAKVVARSR